MQLNTAKIKKFFERLYRSVSDKRKSDMASFDKIVYLLQFILLILLAVFALTI